MYFDELFELVMRIKKRKNDHYKIMLAIISNPHSEQPKALWEILNEDEPMEDEEKPVNLEAEFGKLKGAMQNNPRIVIK